jgi:hypothetical protein
VIAILAAALLQAGSPAGISFEEATTLPTEALAVRALGEYGRQFAAVERPKSVYNEREPYWDLRFFSQPSAETGGVCHMRLLRLDFSKVAPGQPNPATTPGGWRTTRLLLRADTRVDEAYRAPPVGGDADWEAIKVACAGLEPKLEPGWFAADDEQVAERAILFSRQILPLERDGKSEPLAVLVARGGCDAENPLICQADAQPLLDRMRLTNLGFAKGRPCTAFDGRSKLCLLMYFHDPDDVMGGLTIIIHYEEIDEGPGVRILSARATAALVQTQ